MILPANPSDQEAQRHLTTDQVHQLAEALLKAYQHNTVQHLLYTPEERLHQLPAQASRATLKIFVEEQILPIADLLRSLGYAGQVEKIISHT